LKKKKENLFNEEQIIFDPLDFVKKVKKPKRIGQFFMKDEIHNLLIKQEKELKRDLKKQRLVRDVEGVLTTIYGFLLLSIPILAIYLGLINLLPVGFENPIINSSLLISSMAFMSIGLIGLNLIYDADNLLTRNKKGEKK
jgi:hypothetical protein